MTLTLSVLLVNIATLLGAATALATIWWHGRTERYALSWAIALFSGAIAMPLAVLPQPPFSLLSGAVALTGDVLFNIGVFLMADGMARYTGRALRWRRWAFGILFTLCMTAIALNRGDTVLRELLNSGYVQAAALAALLALARVKRFGIAEGLMLGAFLTVFIGNGFYLGHVLVEQPRTPLSIATVGGQVLLMIQPFIVTALAMGGVIAGCLRLIRQAQAGREELAAAAHSALEADRAKSEFLATISHEIRTPINAIQGCLQILDAHGLNAAQARLLQVMESSSRSLLTLVDDVLDMARLEAGRLEIAPTPTDLRELIHDVATAVGPRVAQKGLRLDLSWEGPVPPLVLTDARRLRQIVGNLLGNAVKFTDRGGITFNIAVIPAPAAALPPPDTGLGQPAPVWLRFNITDTGVGIPADKLEGIFQPFIQADGTNTRKFGGAGLGLAIARQLALMMGGDITVRSEAGRGSDFTVTLPLVPTRQPAVRSPGRGGDQPEPGFAGAAVLLVEDDEINRYVTTELLVGNGLQVIHAADGQEALEILSFRPVDVVLMDLFMPGMDGLAAARAIRALPDPAGSVPIVALTAAVTPDIRQQCIDAGMQDFLAKPLRRDNLLAALAAILPHTDEPQLSTGLKNR